VERAGKAAHQQIPPPAFTPLVTNDAPVADRQPRRPAHHSEPQIAETIIARRLFLRL